MLKYIIWIDDYHKQKHNCLFSATTRKILGRDNIADDEPE